MNFLSLNHFLKKKKNWKIQGLTRGSMGLGAENIVTNRWDRINGQWSMVDQAQSGPSGPDNGPGWAGPGPETCRAGRRPRGASGLLLGSGPQGWSTVDSTVQVHGP